MNVLIKETPTDLPAPFYSVRTQREVCSLEEGPLLTWLPDLASTTVRNKCLLFIPPNICFLLLKKDITGVPGWLSQLSGQRLILAQVMIS